MDGKMNQNSVQEGVGGGVAEIYGNDEGLQELMSAHC